MKNLLKSFFFLALVCSATTHANDLKIFTDVSRATNEVRVYLQNISKKPYVVLTKNLTVELSGNTLTLSPDRHVLVLNQQMVMLKEDLSYYGAVTLNPGETTYVHRPNVGLKTEEEKVLKYKIQAKWATLHGVWGGNTQTLF